MRTQWQEKVKIADLHFLYKEGGISIQKLASGLAERLKATKYYESDMDFDEIVDCFEDLAEDGSTTVDDYDSVLSDLYDWADYDKRLWLDCFK